MGIWDSIKELAVKAKCGMGFHSGDWTPVPGGPACRKQLFCSDCLETVHSTNHSYSVEWESAEFDYGSDARCQRARWCTHCNEKAVKVVHEGFHSVGKNGNCQLIERCSRCSHQRVGPEDHSWVRSFQSTGNSTVRVVCVGCNKEEIRSHF
jgi:hypothetical protein